MVLHALALEKWFAALTKVKAVPDRLIKNFTTEDAEEKRVVKNH